MKETILSTQDIFDGRIVHLKLHTVELPNGEQTIREVIQHQGAAAIVAINSEREILLVKQFRIGAGIETYEIPAGLLEPDEVPVATATRELQEETGYRPLNVKSLGGWYVAPGYTNEYLHLYYADGYEYDPLEQDNDEFVETLKVPFTTALEMVENGTINEAKTILALLKVARYLGV